MSEREKLLGIVVGGLLALFAVFGIYQMVSGGIKQKQIKLAGLQGEFKEEKRKNMVGMQNKDLLSKYQKLSLPDDKKAAQLEFDHWLNKQVDAVGLQKKSVRPQPIPRGSKKAYTELTFSVTGLGDIKQITQLLYKIHSLEKLHRVRSIDLVKQDGNLLKLNMYVDAISMPDLPDLQKTPTGELLRPLPLPLETYQEKIANRNLFSPGNQAPRLDSLRTQEVELGKSLSYQIRATDPDDDNLRYELDDSAPASVKISKSGTVSWRPDELGEYEFKVYVVDSGIPSKEDIGTLKVTVIPEREDEPVVEDDFDESKLAVLTGIVQGARDPKPQMCMTFRDKDESKYLQEGDELKVGNWRGKIIAVSPDRNTVRLETDEGEFELKLGEALSDAKAL